MRIVYLHQHFRAPSEAGGTRSYEFAKRLADAGHDVQMVTAHHAPREHLSKSMWEHRDMDGFRVHYVQMPYSNRMSFSKRIESFLKFAWRSAGKAAVLEGDVIFATSTPLTIALPAVYAKWKTKASIVFEVRDLWPELPIALGALRSKPSQMAARWLERFAYRHAEHIVALSPGMADGVTANRGARGKPVSVITNSSDIDLFQSAKPDRALLQRRYGVPSDGPLMLYGGTLGLANDVTYLIEMMAELRKRVPAARLLIVGDGAEREKVEAAATEKALLGNSVFMVTSAPKSDMPSILASADVCFSVFANIPALFHNSANKFFDALAAAKPVGINYPGWQAQVLGETGAGFTMPPEEPVAAAGIVSEWLADATRRAAAGQAALALARERFSRDLHAQQLERILREVADLSVSA
ncbi:MAG: glycosyltransferase family 4 protein [Pseudomonadota bacterium]